MRSSQSRIFSAICHSRRRHFAGIFENFGRININVRINISNNFKAPLGDLKSGNFRKYLAMDKTDGIFILLSYIERLKRPEL